MDEDYLDINFFGTDKNNNILTDPLELFMHEVFIAVQNGPNTLWGISESINLTKYVFNRYITLLQIRNEIQTYIGKHCAHAQLFNHEISVDLINNDGKDLIYITLKVNVPDENRINQEYVQKFLLGN